MDVWTYFDQREREHAALSVVADEGFLWREREGSNGQAGRIFGRVILNDRAYLHVDERVVVRDGAIHRWRYAYFLVGDEIELWGLERDPMHDPPEHGHGRSHIRVPAGRVTFHEAVELAWDTLDREDLHREDLDRRDLDRGDLDRGDLDRGDLS